MNEADKLVCLFCENIGKVFAVAKGAKKNKSKFLSPTQNFCFGEYMLYRGKSMYSMNEGTIVDSFNEFLDDIETITYACYFCELVDISMVEEESNNNLFKTLVSAFYLLKSKAIDPNLLARAFEVKLLQATGYGLNLDNCCICKRPIQTSDYISLKYSGGVCNECTKVNGIRVSNSSYNILKFIIKSPIKNIYRVTITKESNEELSRLLSNFISSNYYKVPKSLDMLHYLKKE